MVKLEEPYLKGDYLKCKNSNVPLIHLAKHCILRGKSLKLYDFFYSNEKEIRLVAINKNSGKEAILLPAYKALCKMNYKGRLINIVIRSAMDSSDYYIGNNIIDSNHYLKPPYKGMMIVAEIESDDDHKYLLENMVFPNAISPYEKLLIQSSKIIGCAVIDQLTYASPKGRIMIARELGIEDNFISGKDNNGEDLKRDSMINMLKVSWGSRFAVIKVYQGLGIGTLLADHAGIVSSTKMLPTANYIEVFTTHPKAIAQELLNSKNKSFLSKAGYQMYDVALNSDPLFNEKEGKFITHKKLYFYKKVGMSNE